MHVIIMKTLIRLWMVPESWPSRIAVERINSEPEDCNQKLVSVFVITFNK